MGEREREKKYKKRELLCSSGYVSLGFSFLVSITETNHNKKKGVSCSLLFVFCCAFSIKVFRSGVSAKKVETF